MTKNGSYDLKKFLFENVIKDEIENEEEEILKKIQTENIINNINIYRGNTVLSILNKKTKKF